MQFLTRSGALNVNLINQQSIALYGASGSPLPDCSSHPANTKELVYDALSPTYLGNYVSGGSVVTGDLQRLELGYLLMRPSPR
jgi:hypothetical protein